jgi:hypothetical protein
LAFLRRLENPMGFPSYYPFRRQLTLIAYFSRNKLK